MIEYEYHRYADVFPMMTDQEHRELVDDIRAHGQHEPITLYQGQILDGRNRDKACRELGIKQLYVVFEEGDEKALDLVISANMVRRHLTTSQRAMIADDLATLRQGQSKSNASNEASQVEAGKRMHVSRPSVQRARKVKQQGTPELAAAVRQGKTTVSAAVKQIDAKNAHDADVTARAATNGNVDPGIATGQEDGASHYADPGHTDTGDDDDDPPVPGTDEEDEDITDEIGEVGDLANVTAVGSLAAEISSRTEIVYSVEVDETDKNKVLSYLLARPDGSFAKYLPEPQTIGDALKIFMRIETADEWQRTMPGLDLLRLNAHVKKLTAELSAHAIPGKTRAARYAENSKTKGKPTKAKAKSKRKT